MSLDFLSAHFDSFHSQRNTYSYFEKRTSCGELREEIEGQKRVMKGEGRGQGIAGMRPKESRKLDFGLSSSLSANLCCRCEVQNSIYDIVYNIIYNNYNR